MQSSTGGWFQAWVFLSGVALLAGCDPNLSGRFAATQFGDRSDVAAPRLTFDASLQEACDTGQTAPITAELLRRPFLQQVQPASTRVLWTGLEDAAGMVRVTRPSGDPVATFDSRLDVEAQPADAFQQVTDVAGLEPEQIYCYSIDAADAAPALGRTGFRTAPAPGSDTPISFVALGDSGEGGEDQWRVFEQMQTVQADLVVHTGDLAYPNGTARQLQENFFDVYEPMMRSVPFFPVAGNHDYHTDAAQPFLDAFSLPENGGPEGKERWYSFDWGNVHFVALDTERVSDAQVEWLRDDLAANWLPWTIVFTHKGPYSSGAHGSNRQFRDTFEPILVEHGVQLVLSGHDHHYERTVPIDGITYVVTGGGGRGVRIPGASDWTAFSHGVLHFLYITIDGPDLRLYAIDATGQEFDFTRIENPRLL